LNVTVLPPWVEPKFVPAMVMVVPTAPEGGDRLVMAAVGSTVNDLPLLDTPLALTTTLPVVAPLGTDMLIEAALQLVIVVAVVALNFTVPLPCVEPKFDPAMVTVAPTTPEVGDRVVILGAATTANVSPLLATPPTVTITLPVVAPLGTDALIEVAPQLVIVVAVIPLNFTVLLPWVEPKFVPVMVTDALTAPVAGDRLVMAGVGSTVNGLPLLDTPLALTTTLPVVALLGTDALIEVALQLVIVVAAVPLNFTAPLPWVEPKFVPVIVRVTPTAPEVGDTLVILGGGTTVKLSPLLVTPATLTATVPVVTPDGTITLIEVSLQLA
jgi:hypothetical protein